MAKAAVGLGSNVGDRLEQLRAAVRNLESRYTVLEVSSLFLTKPIGGPQQDEFLNAVVLLETNDAPASVLAELQRIEGEGGRVRHEHWGPRSLDLDLLTVQGRTIDTEDLVLPHPRAHLRRFVVAPLAEVWPDAELEGGTASDYLRDLVDQKADRIASDWKGDRIHFLDRGTAWVLAQGVLFALFGLVVVLDGSWPTGWSWVGVAAIGTGGFLMLQAAAALGDAFSPFPTPRESALAVRGVYRFLRHPMYTGIVVLFLGTALLVSSIWAGAIALVTAAFFWLKAGFEEKRLRIVYSAYDDYRKQVRGRLIPGVW